MKSRHLSQHWCFWAVGRMDGWFIHELYLHTYCPMAGGPPSHQLQPRGAGDTEGWQDGGRCPPGQSTATCMAAAQVKTRCCLSRLRDTQSLHQLFLTWD